MSGAGILVAVCPVLVSSVAVYLVLVCMSGILVAVGILVWLSSILVWLNDWYPNIDCPGVIICLYLFTALLYHP